MDGPLLETFTEDPDSPRAFRRFVLNFTVGISVSADEDSSRTPATPPRIPATLTNASMSGLGFSSLTEFPEGTLIEIQVDLGSQAHRVPAVVRRCTASKRLGRTFYECGAQYLKSDATMRFLPLMARHLLTRSPERKS